MVWRGRWVGVLMGVGPALGADPWADTVISYNSGTTPTPGYVDFNAALGEPTRFSGVNSPFGANVVSPFSPPFWTDELVSIGEGGHLVVRFDEPLADAATHAFGVDLLIFGNGGFVDFDFPNGRTSPDLPPQTFGMDAEMRVAVSADGSDWFEYPDNFLEGFFPTLGYLDGGPFDANPGALLSDFRRPVDPNLKLNDFSNRSLAEIRGLYAGSGGGTPVDLAVSGLSEVRFVRIRVLDDGDPGTALNVEIDALSAVPEPTTLTALSLLSIGVLSRRR